MKHPETITGVMWSLLRVTLNAFIDTDTNTGTSRDRTLHRKHGNRVTIEHHIAD